MDTFVGIGAQKSGTSWLHDQLVKHPEICLPARKEVHYFDMFPDNTVSREKSGLQRIAGVRRAVSEGRPGVANNTLDVLELAFRGDAAYVDYISRDATDQTKALGEITPAYSCLNERGFDHLKRTLDPKIVFIMRDPLERYWSMVRMTTRHNEDLERTFSTMIEQPGLWARSDYGRTIRTVDAMFDPSQVLYLFYEELFNDATMNRLLSFLGVDSSFAFDYGTRSRTGESHPMPTIPHNVREKLESVYRDVEERFGSAVPAKWARNF